MEKLHSAIKSALRETDIRGWYDHDRVIGIILTEMASLDEPSIGGIIRKIHGRLNEKLGGELVKRISVSFHIFPEPKEPISINGPFDVKLYPELNKKDFGYQFSMAVKKVIDTMGSSVALLIFSPVFLAVSVAIKWDSEGPVFFRQKRLGLNGQELRSAEIQVHVHELRFHQPSGIYQEIYRRTEEIRRRTRRLQVNKRSPHHPRRQDIEEDAVLTSFRN